MDDSSSIDQQRKLAERKYAEAMEALISAKKELDALRKKSGKSQGPPRPGYRTYVKMVMRDRDGLTREEIFDLAFPRMIKNGHLYTTKQISQSLGGMLDKERLIYRDGKYWRGPKFFGDPE